MSNKFSPRIWDFFLVFSIAPLLFACSWVSPSPNTPQPSTSPIVSPSPIVPIPSRTPATPNAFAILAHLDWDTTALFIRPGQQFEVSATGSWSVSLDENPYGPGGGDKFEPDAILPSAPIGALLGRIGNNPPFVIGEHLITTAEFGGELQFRINDQPEALSDNTGTLEVAVVLGPEPLIPTQILTNENDGYRVLIPAEYQAVIYDKGMCLTVSGAWMMACHVASAYIEVIDTGGWMLSQVADEVAAQGNPDIPVKRTSLTVSGLEALLLDDIYTYDVLRKVVIVNGERTYILTFVPWNDQMEDFPRLENLYNTMISSFTFLPKPEVAVSPESEIQSYISAVNPVTIYSGPGFEYPPAGILEAGAAAGVIGGQEVEYWPDRWLKITCPEGLAGECWILWDMNSLYSYEGTPVTLNIPDPATLRIEYTNTYTSPDERWQALATESEQVSLDGDLAFFFYVEFSVTSLEDGTTWKPVSEWHVAGLGHEPAPRPFHWSQNGRYLYYTNDVVPDGGCGFFANSGESLDRLDLSDGSVAVMRPPHIHWILAISPDETRISYLDGDQLIVRDMAAAYGEETTEGHSIQWRIPLNIVSPEVVSQIGWSPDGKQVLVTVTEIASNCQPVRATEWALEVPTREFKKGTTIIYPTPAP